jgi:hypothetical protein
MKGSKLWCAAQEGIFTLRDESREISVIERCATIVRLIDTIILPTIWFYFWYQLGCLMVALLGLPFDPLGDHYVRFLHMPCFMQYQPR